MAVPSIDELNLLHTRICQAVGDPKRILIMYALHERPRHTTALGRDLNMPQPTVSRHLSVLRDRGLVKTERDGAAVIYRLVDDRIIDVLEIMRELLRDTLINEAEILE